MTRETARQFGGPPRSTAATIADALLVLSAILLFTISANTLYAFGIPYEAPGGSTLAKFHPGTYVAVAALLARMAAVGPRRSCELMLASYPGTCAFAAACLFSCAYIVVILHEPVTPVIESFILPVVLFASLVLSRTPVRWLLPIIELAFLANALIGIGEFFAGHRLAPFVAGAVVVEGDWRSTALFGHPLVNATLTAHYIAIMVFGPREVSPAWRFGMIGLQTAALTAFGGRTALVLVGLLLVGAGLYQGARALAGARMPLWRLAVGIGAAVGVALVVAILVERGSFDLLVGRFMDDSGSANTRVVMFRLFAPISGEDLLFGPDRDFVESLMFHEGLEFGIESFPLALTMFYGLVIAALLMGGLAAFLIDLVRATRPASVGVLMFFLLIAVTSTSLSSKTTLLAMLSVMLLVFYVPEGGFLRQARRRDKASMALDQAGLRA